jgi:hypothetical protein
MQKSNNTTKRSQGSRPAKKKGDKSRSQASQAPKTVTKVEKIPSAIGVTNKQVGPAKITGEGAKVIVRHSEFIRGIDGGASPVGFQILTRLRMNPGSSVTFNWLSKIAACYESYRFRKFALRYEPRCPTTISGSMITSYDYDAADNPLILSTEQALYNNMGTVDASLWMRQVNPARPELMNKLYKAHVVMTDARFASTSQDEKTIDCGQAIVAIDSDSTAAFGKLFVDYEVELWNPQQVTEGLAEGGAVIDKVGGLAVSAKPILDLVAITTREEPTPILRTVDDLIAGGANITLPTCVVGQFLQDWQGAVTARVDGAGLLLGPRFAVRPGTSDPNDSAGAGVGDVVQGLVMALNQANFAATNAVSASHIDAHQGDYLLLNTITTGGALTSLLTQFGGSTAY